MSNKNAAGPLSRVLDQNPLALGLVALVIGALIGALIPELRKEHELMGPTRDQLADKAQATLEDLSHKAGVVAGVAQTAAQEALDKAQDAAKAAMSEALDSVKEEAKIKACRSARNPIEKETAARKFRAAVLPLIGCDLDLFRLGRFGLGQVDFQHAVFVRRADFVLLDRDAHRE